MTCQCRSMSRTLAASSTQRLVNQAQGHSGSNQKSTRAVVGALWTASVIVGVLLASPGPRDRAALLPSQSGSDPACSLHGWTAETLSCRRGKLAGVAATNLTRTDAAAPADLL